MRLWRHFRKLECGFRVGGDSDRQPTNRRSSSVTDRRPESRVAFWWTNFWSSISGQLAARRTRGDGKNDAEQPPFARCFWLVSLMCLVSAVWAISRFDRADWGWSGVSRAASAVHTLSSRLNAGLRCVFHFTKLSCLLKVCNNVSNGSCGILFFFFFKLPPNTMEATK